MTEREIMLSGGMYNPCDSELTELRKRARLLTEEYNRTSVTEPEKRTRILRELFGSCGECVLIEPDFHCDYGCNIYVGENFFANFGFVVLDVCEVRIGANCMIAPQVGIYAATHPLDAALRNSGRELGKPVNIGDNCWIGGGAIIHPGVTLGNGVVVASGAVVTKSFGDNVVIGGNPAHILKEIT